MAHPKHPFFDETSLAVADTQTIANAKAVLQTRNWKPDTEAGKKIQTVLKLLEEAEKAIWGEYE